MEFVPDERISAGEKSIVRRFYCSFKKEKAWSCHTFTKKKLHWLPVRFRIEFKTNLLTFKCLHGHAPKYLTDLLCRYEPVRNLRSASKNNMLQEKCIRLQKTDRAFSVAAPKLWNELPDYLREIDKLSSFKSALKAHYFRIVFK